MFAIQKPEQLLNNLVDAYLLITLTVASAMFIGGLLFAGTLVPSVATRVLTEHAAAAFLRAFWPRFYGAGIVGAALLTLVTGALAPLSPLPITFTALLCCLAAIMAMAFWSALQLIPAINAARDQGDARFASLHRGAVALTMYWAPPKPTTNTQK